MRLLPIKVLSFALLFWLCLGVAFGAERGETVQRIVSLKPNLTEILFALGLGEQVVGVTNYCDFPAAAQKIAKVGTFLEPNVEAIVALKPTLVVGENSGSRDPVVQMERLGMNVRMLNFKSLEQLYVSIENLGDLTGRKEQAKALNKKLREGLQTQRHYFRAIPTLVVVGKEPLMVVGQGNFIGEMLGLLGAENIAHDGVSAFPRFSEEALISRKPEVIVDVSMGSEDIRLRKKRGAAFWQRFRSVPAVKNQRIYYLDCDIVLRPGPRLVDGFQELERAVHGLQNEY